MVLVRPPPPRLRLFAWRCGLRWWWPGCWAASKGTRQCVSTGA